MWDFSNLENYRTALDDCDFGYCNNINDINMVVELWKNQIYNLALTYIPNKLVEVRSSDQVWYNNELKKLLRKKIDYIKRPKSKIQNIVGNYSEKMVESTKKSYWF